MSGNPFSPPSLGLGRLTSTCGRSTKQSWKGRLRRAYRAAYPWANTAFEVWLLVYNIAYLFERTTYYRPWLSWVGVDLRRLSVDDMVCALTPYLLHSRDTG